MVTLFGRIAAFSEDQSGRSWVHFCEGRRARLHDESGLLSLQNQFGTPEEAIGEPIRYEMTPSGTVTRFWRACA